MIYLKLAGVGAQSKPTLQPAPPPVVTPLTMAERRVVGFARHDTAASPTRGRLVRFAGYLFGLKAPNPLADRRIETLRRFAIVASRPKRVRKEEFSALHLAGFR